jgi:hypothetical protein
MTCLSGFHIETCSCESYRNIYCQIELFETGHLPILNDIACLVFNVDKREDINKFLKQARVLLWTEPVEKKR